MTIIEDYHDTKTVQLEINEFLLGQYNMLQVRVEAGADSLAIHHIKLEIS